MDYGKFVAPLNGAITFEADSWNEPRSSTARIGLSTDSAVRRKRHSPMRAIGLFSTSKGACVADLPQRFVDREIRNQLSKQEKIVLEGTNTVLAVAEALQTIRDEKLYRLDYKTFDEYCAATFDFSGRYARKLLSSPTENNSQNNSQNSSGSGNSTDTAGSSSGTNGSGTETSQGGNTQSDSNSSTQNTGTTNGENTEAGQGEKEDEAQEPVFDAAGVQVPCQALIAFERAKDLKAVCQEIDKIIEDVGEIAKGPGGRLIRFESFKQQMQDAKGNLWANRATHVCPYCKGIENGKLCECCNGEGWTAKHVWQAAPGNDKKAIA